MIKFIADYYKLGIRFSFRECENCGMIRIVLVRELKINNNISDFLIANTCVEPELFKDEEKLIIELTNVITNMFKINPDELQYQD